MLKLKVPRCHNRWVTPLAAGLLLVACGQSQATSLCQLPAPNALRSPNSNPEGLDKNWSRLACEVEGFEENTFIWLWLSLAANNACIFGSIVLAQVVILSSVARSGNDGNTLRLGDAKLPLLGIPLSVAAGAMVTVLVGFQVGYALNSKVTSYHTFVYRSRNLLSDLQYSQHTPENFTNLLAAFKKLREDEALYRPVETVPNGASVPR